MFRVNDFFFFYSYKTAFAWWSESGHEIQKLNTHLQPRTTADNAHARNRRIKIIRIETIILFYSCWLLPVTLLFQHDT